MSTYPIDIAPSVQDVAALLRARTKDSNGYEVGTFSSDGSITERPAQERQIERQKPPSVAVRDRISSIPVV
jgi:hypothetical protein